MNQLSEMERTVATGLPTKNPFGAKLAPENIQLHRTSPRDYKVVDALVNSFDVVKNHPAETIVTFLIAMFGYFIVYMIVYVLFMILMFATGLLTVALMEVNQTLAQIVNLGVLGIGTILMTVVSIVAQTTALGAYFVVILRIVRGQPAEIGSMAEVKPFIKPLVITAIVLSFAILAGAVMLIIPAYIIMLGCYFAQLVVIDKNLSGVAALKASWALTDGHKLNLLGFLLLATVLNFVGMIPCGLGMFVTVPMTLIGMVTIYDALAEPGNAYAPEANASAVFS